MFSSLAGLQNWVSSQQRDQGSNALKETDTNLNQIPGSGLEIAQNHYFPLVDQPHVEIDMENTVLDVEPKVYELESESVFPFGARAIYRLVGAWFVTVAAGSVLVSIPVAIGALPMVLFVGGVGMILTALVQWIIRKWINFIIICLRLIKDLLLSPRYLLSLTGTIIKRSYNLLFGPQSAPKPLPGTGGMQNKLVKKASSFDRGKQTVSSLEWNRPDEHFKTLYDTGARTTSRSTFSKHIQSIPAKDIKRNLRQARNPQFLFLAPEDEYRLQLCTELYLSATNLQTESAVLKLGKHENGHIHYILSIWDEPETQANLKFEHIIGFCDVILFSSSILCLLINLEQSK
jgi:hypothetical protein